MTLLPIILALAGWVSTENPQTSRFLRVRSESIGIQTSQGPESARGADLALTLRLPKGKHEAVYILAVFERASGAFWWKPEVEDVTVPVDNIIVALKATTRLVVVDSRLVSFSVTRPFLDIRQSTERVRTLQDGLDKAVKTVDANIAAIENRTLQWFTRVDLSSLRSAFFFRPGHPDEAIIERVSLVGGKWELVLRGPNKDSVLVTLDPSYKLIGTRRLP
jgi:hypothetical protein